MHTAGSGYHVRVRVADSAGNMLEKALAIKGMGVPAPDPPVLESVSAGDAAVELHWKPAAGADRYHLYYGTAPGNYEADPITVAADVNRYSVTGLANGTAYYFAVTASNAGGESPYSNELSATPQVPAPGAPVLRVETVGNAAVTLAWDAVAGAETYRVYTSTISGQYAGRRPP